MATAEPTTNDERLRDALDQLRSVLIPNETLEAWAVQRRIFALFHRRVLIAATSGRFIAVARHLISGFHMTDLRWQDLHDAKLHMGIFGADLILSASTISDLASAGTARRYLTHSGFIKEQAREVYRLCQAQEQAWREKRRVRDLEEMRARSGGIQLSGAGAASDSAGAAPAQLGTPVARLQQAKEMLDANLITDAEYEAIKARIIGSV